MIRRRIEYLALRAARRAFRAAGVGPGARALAAALFAAGVRRRVVLENLGRAFPEKADAERERIARDCYLHYARLLLEAPDWFRWTEADWRDRVAVEGVEELKSLAARSRGVILLVGHLGAYELGPARLSYDGIRLLSVYQPVHNPFVEREILSIRRLGGAEVADRRMGLRKVLRWLAEGGVVTMLADEDAGPSGAFVPFFGHPASTHRGPAALARRTGAALVTGHVVRRPGGGYLAFWEDPIPHGSDEAMLAEYHRRLEARIRDYPDQYFWFHRRWKTAPP